ncbi:hypothetical protein CDAR_595571 [Caerostris darwini]|uniref:Uncharacterized protein n=1 Tax=Caerostris darwini TaxID=1538125 RepID=A0AAV4P5D7_9ARAC|nr:hypothetical protein CDAR_595571 [Caerostris darwini]
MVMEWFVVYGGFSIEEPSVHLHSIVYESGNHEKLLESPVSRQQRTKVKYNAREHNEWFMLSTENRLRIDCERETIQQQLGTWYFRVFFNTIQLLSIIPKKTLWLVLIDPDPFLSAPL